MEARPKPSGEVETGGTSPPPGRARTDTILRLKGKKAPLARGAAPKWGTDGP